MKLVFMTYYIGMHQDVREILAECGVVSYTHWDEVTGRLSCGVPRDGTDVWPRTSPEGRPAVYRTRDAGHSWERQDRGLPERGWFTVKRQALGVDDGAPVGVYFGTTSGEIWGSGDEGASWRCLAAHLPEIYAVEVSVIA